MPPSRNDLWLILIIAGLCATAAGFVYLNNLTRSMNRVMKQQTASLISQLEDSELQVEEERNRLRMFVDYSEELKSLLRQLGSHVPPHTLAHLFPAKGIEDEDMISFRPVDAAKLVSVRSPSVRELASFVVPPNILKALGRMKE